MFDGKTYDPALDYERLNTLLERVFAAMLDGTWYTLPELQRLAGGTEASVSARVRDFRKMDYDVESKRVDGGLWRYRLVL